MKVVNIVRAAIAASAFVACEAYSRDWYIDANLGSDETGDGTAELPFATINRASTNSTDLATGDTIWVRPGTYVTGTFVDGDGVSNRVYIAKNINLKATNPEQTTEIVGAKDETSGNSLGLGTAAVRCIRSSGACVIEGFTLRDGATDVGDANKGYGGGYFGSGYLVDCVVRNCSATKGGGVRNGYVVRSLITECTASSNGGASNGGELYFCVVASCGGSGSVSNSKTVNCTFVGIRTNPIVGSTASYNCLFLATAAGCASTVPVNNGVTAANGGEVQLMNPALGDFRPILGSVAATAGDRSHLALVPEAYRGKDFLGDDIAETGDIPVGAVFSTGTPIAGCIYFKGGAATVDGRVVGDGLWMFPTNYPVQWTVAPVVPAGSHFYCFIHDDNKGWRSYAQMDGTCRMIPPPDPSMVTTSTVTFASKAYWVNPDPAIGSDSNSGTDADHPFLTLQKCVDSAGYNLVKTVVYAAAGEYNRGGCSLASAQGAGYYMTNRVACTMNNCEVLIRGAGAGRSFIVGAPDPTTGGAGRGAVRVAALFSAYAALQGFTLCGGYTDTSDGPSATQEKYGVFLRGSYAENCSRLIDCTVSNVTAATYIVRGGKLERCRIVNNVGGNNTIDNVSAMSTLFAGNRHASGNTGISGTTRLVGCTIVGYGSNDLVLQRNSAGLYLSIVDTASYLYKSSGACISNLVQNIGSMESGVYGFKNATINYADRENYDFRIGKGSKAASNAGDCTGESWFLNVYKDLSGDIDGESMSFEGGAPVIGAFRAPLPVVTVQAANGGVTSSMGRVSNMPVAGELTISRSGDATVPCIGFVVCGVTNLFDTATSVVLTRAEIEAAGGIAQVEPIYTSDWYVDSEHGDDVNNSGMTKGDAFLTLARALTNSMLTAGQTVHAAAGTYAAGEIAQSSGVKTLARAIVKSNVTLVGDEGAEKTFIVGRDAPDAGENGLGDGAVRCVYLKANATVRGFTLTGGRTRKASASEKNEEKTQADWTGGAVRGDALTSVVADCIISNNCANRGGGAYGATLLRCRVVGNKSVNGGAGAVSSSAIGTLFAKNTGSAYVLLYPADPIIGCTFTSDNTPTYSAFLDGNRQLVNNVFEGGKLYFNFTTQNAIYMTNCVFTTAPGYKTGGSFTYGVGSFTTNATALALGADGRPAVGSVCADAAYVDEDILALMGERDASGEQRIYNNALDIGALEADFRPAFAKAMGGGGRISVTAADPSVRLVNGGVAISSGCLDAVWRSSPGTMADFSFNAEVSGSGTLTATVNGAATVLDASAGSRSIAFSGDSGENAMSFAFAPDTEAPGGMALLSGFSRRIGIMLIVR